MGTNQRGAYLEGVVQHDDDLIVVVRDGHFEVQAVEFREVSGGARFRKEAG